MPTRGKFARRTGEERRGRTATGSHARAPPPRSRRRRRRRRDKNAAAAILTGGSRRCQTPTATTVPPDIRATGWHPGATRVRSFKGDPTDNAALRAFGSPRRKPSVRRYRRRIRKNISGAHQAGALSFVAIALILVVALRGRDVASLGPLPRQRLTLATCAINRAELRQHRTPFRHRRRLRHLLVMASAPHRRWPAPSPSL
jgi:hypothetical protein